jgi:hypothetical protein
MKWYLGFLTKDTVEIFRSSKTPTKALVPFYHSAVGPYASEDAAKRDARRQRVVLKNPGEVDSVSARELELYIENNGDLYRQMYTPVVNNLLRKMKKGTYNPILAEKGWLYLVDEGARRYNKEFGNGSLSLKLFDVPTRKEVARRFARSFEKEVEIGGYKLNPKPKKNPPLMVIGNPPTGDLMSDSVHEIRYTHRGDGEAYKHTFKKGVRMVAEEDGSISMYHPTKRIHEEFPE